MVMFQLAHKNRRDEFAADKKMLDELSASVQRANLILSEFVMGLDAKHIVSFAVKTSSVKFERFSNYHDLRLSVWDL